MGIYSNGLKWKIVGEVNAVIRLGVGRLSSGHRKYLLRAGDKFERARARTIIKWPDELVATRIISFPRHFCALRLPYVKCTRSRLTLGNRWVGETWANESRFFCFVRLEFDVRFMLRANVLHSVLFVMEFFDFGFAASVLFSFVLSPYGGNDSLADRSRSLRFRGQNHTRSMPPLVTIEIRRKNSHRSDAVLWPRTWNLDERGLIEWIIRQTCSPVGCAYTGPSSLFRIAHTAYRNAKMKREMSRCRLISALPIIFCMRKQSDTCTREHK